MSVDVVHAPSPASLEAARGGSLLDDFGFPLQQEAGGDLLLEAQDRVPQGRVAPYPHRLTVAPPRVILGPVYAELLIESGTSSVGTLLQETLDAILIQTMANTWLSAVTVGLARVHAPQNSTRLGVA